MSSSRSRQQATEKSTSDDADVICKVSATKVGFPSKGNLAIKRINDTLYMVDFQGPFADNIHVDLDCVEFVPDNRIINLIPSDGRALSYVVSDAKEYEVFMEAKTECESVCDLKLRLNSLLRDVYFSGLYSTLKTDHKMKIKDEVEKLKIEAPNLFFSTLPDRMDSAAEIEKERHSVESHASKAVCAFCFKVRATEKDLAFAIHPYVPKNFQGQTIYMCNTCVENWKEYRDAADHHHLLVLENEVNEEVCAVCSDTPDTLVLCSSCPRSFCHTCLLKILSKNDHKALTAEDADWQCMCCANGIDALPPMTRDSWVRIRSINAIEAEKQKKKEAGQASSSAAAAVATSASAAAGATVKETVEELSRRPSRRQDKMEAHTAGGEQGPDAASAAVSSSAQDTGRRGRHARHAVKGEDMDVVDHTVAAPAVTASGGGRGKRKLDAAAIAVKEEEEEQQEQPMDVLPPVSQEFDELYYFSQYVSYIDSATHTILHGTKKEVNEAQTMTDDSCFLCKDGGELIECDWKHPSKKKCRCLKVYHEYCLEYAVDDGVKWCCPRHFCDVCGSQSLKYICKYCTLSICANCPSELVKRYGYVNYSELEDLTGEFEGSVPIACHNCVGLIERSLARKDLLENLHYPLDLKLKKFPGVAGKKKEGVFRVVRGPRGSASAAATAGVFSSSSSSSAATGMPAVKNEERSVGAPVESAPETEEMATAQGVTSAEDKEKLVMPDSELFTEPQQPQPQHQEEIPVMEPTKASKTPRKRTASKEPVAESISPSAAPAAATQESDSNTSSSVSAATASAAAPATSTSTSSSATSATSVPYSAQGSTGSSSRSWPEHEIQLLMEGGRVYGLDVDKMLKDPSYSHMLIFRTQAQIKSKLIKLFEADPARPTSAAKEPKASSSSTAAKEPKPTAAATEPAADEGGSKSTNKPVKGVLKKGVLSGNDVLPFL